MKVENERSIVKYEGDNIELMPYTVKVNGKLIKILSEGYADKPAAVIRELSTNAYDSQIENGNPNQPIDVKLPTVLDSIFYVRDYGTGLSPERVNKVFRTYGVSTKDQSNEYNDGFGIGSKCIFAYHSKTATIESWHDGIHYIYNAHLGEDGVPILAKLSEQPSNEPSGVKITVPTDYYGYATFAERATKIYRYFKVIPNFIGSNKPEIKRVEYNLQGNGWSLRKNDSGGCRAIMGNVSYPIYFADVSLSVIHNTLLSSCPVDIMFSVGEVDVEPYKEGLNYDVKTKTAIVTKLKDVEEKIVSLLTDSIQNETKLWNARISMVKFMKTFPSGLINQVDLNKITWNGQKLFDACEWGDYVISLPKDIKHIKYELYDTRLRKSEASTIKPNAQIVFSEEDLKTGNLSRIREWLTQNISNDYNLYSFNFKNDKGEEDSETPKLRKAVCEKLGIDESDFIRTSAMPNPPPMSKSGVGRTALTKVVKLSDKHHNKISHYWHDCEIDIKKDSGYYVEFNLYQVLYKDKKYKPRDIVSLLENLNSVGHTFSSPIYGVKTAHIPQLLRRKSNWVNFLDHALSLLEGELTATSFDDIILAQEELRKATETEYINYNYKYRIDIDNILKIDKYVKPKSLFKEYTDKLKGYQKIAKNYEKINIVKNVLDRWNIKVKDVQSIMKKGELLELSKQVHKKYGLLECLASSFHFDSSCKISSKAEQIAEYVNLLS